MLRFCFAVCLMTSLSFAALAQPPEVQPDPFAPIQVPRLTAPFDLAPAPTRPKGGVPVWGLDFSPDSSMLAAAAGARQEQGLLRIWNTRGWSIKLDHKEERAVTCVAFSPDSRSVAMGLQSGEVAILDVKSKKVTRRWHTRRWAIFGITWTPDGNEIVTALANGLIRVWNAETQELRLTMDTWEVDEIENPRAGGVRDRNLWNLDVSSDGRHLLSGAWNGTTRLWDLQTGEQLKTFIGVDKSTQGVEFSRDDQYFVANGLHCPVVHLRQTDSGNTLATLEAGGGRDAAIHPDGHWIAATSFTGVKLFWVDLREPNEELAAKIGSAIGNLASEEASVKNAAATTLVEIGLPAVAPLRSAMEEDPSIVGKAEPVLAEITQLEPSMTLDGQTGPLRRVLFSPRGDYLAISTDRGNVRVFHVIGFQLEQEFTVKAPEPET